MKSFFIVAVLLTGTFLHLTAQAYFQQEVNYTLSVALNDRDHTLTGFETIEYINNSTESLPYLYFHLWPNAYKDNESAFARQQLEHGDKRFHFAGDDKRGYIDSLDFRVNGQSLEWTYDDAHADICKILLPELLEPGDTVVITTPFFVKIPGAFSRFGHVGQSYQITQWYPKPAVYDRHGWNKMPYLDQGEFYSEYGSFDVSITLPRNYVVGATGNLVTPEEADWLNWKAADTTSLAANPASVPELKTIRYKEENIHDFAWFADKQYLVDKGEVVLKSGKKVSIWAMYPPSQAAKWKDALTYLHDAITYYSAWYMDYPYNNCSAVFGRIEAGGAMEYPTITVVGNAGTTYMLEEYIMHEVGHNWFYGILGFNERTFPYLDEGLNTFSEFRYMRTKYPQLKIYQWMMGNPVPARLANISNLPYTSMYELIFLASARENFEQPINLHSEQFSSLNYGSMAYYKAALVFTYLMQSVGEDKFNAIMQEFFNNWQYRHPGPDDLRKAFEENTDEELAWLFDDLMGTTKRLNYGISKVQPGKVLVKNYGQVASPVKLTLKNDGEALTSAWYPGFSGKKWLELPTSSGNRVVLFDSVWLPEINRHNNFHKTAGLLRKTEPVNLHPLQLLENPGSTRIGIMPALGWNNYNKTLLGIVVYSPLLFTRTLEFQLMPMVGLGNHDVAGMGKVTLNLFPRNGIIRTIQLSAKARRFGYFTENGNSYNTAGGDVNIVFRNAEARSKAVKTLKISGVIVDEPQFQFDHNLLHHYYFDIDASLSQPYTLYSYSVGLNMEKSNNYLRASVELKAALHTNYARNAIQFRAFVGGFLDTESDFGMRNALRLSGASGYYDTKYNDLYLGRFETLGDPNRQKLLSQQFTADHGGFASNNPFAYSDKWLASAGLTVKVPRLPVSLFVNAGTYSGAGDSWLYESVEKDILSELIPFETGAMLSISGILKVYFPVWVSRDMAEINDLFTENYWQTIRYSISFNQLNPWKLRNTIFQ